MSSWQADLFFLHALTKNDTKVSPAVPRDLLWALIAMLEAFM